MSHISHYFSLDTEKLKATQNFKAAQKAVYMKEKRRLCDELLDKLGIMTMVIGHGNTGNGLTGKRINVY